MLTFLALAFIALAIVLALRQGGSPRGAFDLSRDRLRDDARNPAKLAPIFLVVAAFFVLMLATGSARWEAMLFAFVIAAAFLATVMWFARR